MFRQMVQNNRRTVKLADVKRLAKLQCTDREAAAFFGIRHSTFRQLLAEDPKVKEAWYSGKSLGCISLRRKQFRLAGQNATMAIFLGKQMLGQRDQHHVAVTDSEGEPLDLSGLSKEERDKVRQLLARGESNKDSDTE